MLYSRPNTWFAAASFVLFSIFAWAWIYALASPTPFEAHYDWHKGDHEDHFGVVSGQEFGWCRFTYHPGQDLSWVRSYHKMNWTFLGFGFLHIPAYTIGTNGVKFNTDLQALVVPCWFLIILTAILPVRWLILTLRHRKRVTENLCKNCGYDLRAHHPGDKCPECGAAIPTLDH